MPRKLTEKDVTFEVSCEPEIEQIEGNASAIGPEEDAETYKWIRDQLAVGNDWAWCCVKVVGRIGPMSATTYLGCCSYFSETDFCKPGDYYDDMKAEVLAELQQQVDALAPLVCDHA